MSDSTNNIRKFLAAILASVQDVENALQQLYRERRIDTAVGAQLDVIGKVVGQSRMGLSDDVYRRYCRARIATNRSRGSAEDLIRVSRLVLADDAVYVHLQRGGIASVTVRLEDAVVTHEVARIALGFLKQAVAAGVRLVVEFLPQAPADSFCFLGGPGKGFGSSQIVADGGKFAGALS